MITISVINTDESGLTDEEVAPYCSAQQIQLARDYQPEWGGEFQILQICKGEMPPPGSWWLVMLGKSDEESALGYHDRTSEGLPLGKVFIKSSQENGFNWTITASHEVMEMCHDGDINSYHSYWDAQGNEWLALDEICDPSENDRYAYQINGIALSDFVWQCYYDPENVGQATQSNAIQGCFPKLAPGGYISVRKLAPTKWEQFTDRRLQSIRQEPNPSSRRTKVTKPRAQQPWSTAHE